MLDEWLQNKLGVSFHVSLQCVSCELKFFTGTGASESSLMQFYRCTSIYLMLPKACMHGSETPVPAISLIQCLDDQLKFP